jgi:hypothetical protein
MITKNKWTVKYYKETKKYEDEEERKVYSVAKQKNKKQEKQIKGWEKTEYPYIW